MSVTLKGDSGNAAENRLLWLPAVRDNAAMRSDPPNAALPKRKRRWFQFSLRSLMIFTLICAIPCAWLGRKIEQKRKEREAVAAIVKLGGQVMYGYYPGAKPPGPDWLRRILGENFFQEVDSVRWGWLYWGPPVSHGNLTDSELELVKDFTQLHTLMLAGDNVNVTDAGLVNLRRLTRLQQLWLAAPNVTDAELANLQGLTQLQLLSLENTRVTDAGLKNLKGLTQLHYLYLQGTKVSDAGLENFQGLTQLIELVLRETNISNAGPASLKGLTKLRDLDLQRTKVTDAGKKDLLKALPNCRISR